MPSGNGQPIPVISKRVTVSHTVEAETPQARAILWLLRPASNLSRRISFAFFIDTLLCAIEVGLLPVGCGRPTLEASWERRYVTRDRKRPCRSPIRSSAEN